MSTPDRHRLLDRGDESAVVRTSLLKKSRSSDVGVEVLHLFLRRPLGVEANIRIESARRMP